MSSYFSCRLRETSRETRVSLWVICLFICPVSHQVRCYNFSMKKLTLTTLVFSLLMFSSTSFADWTKVSENADGYTFYVDFERIRKHGGYVYFWSLDDYLKPNKSGYLSDKVYQQGDCKLFRFKYLSFSFHKEPMGEGTGEIENKPDKEWNYPSPNSSIEEILKKVCRYAK